MVFETIDRRTMTPKDKAKELFNKFCYAIRTEERGDGYYTNVFHAKECALIAVDEVLKLSDSHKIIYSKFNNNELTEYTEFYYWQQVKKEIEAL
jgi:hypothetical protein